MNNWPIPVAGSMSRLIPGFAFAIGKAEGFGVTGAIPTRANNPGDLVLGSVGFGTLGTKGITIYPTFDQGVRALYRELNLILTNTSRVYTNSMTFSQIAVLWTGNDNPIGWASTVAKSLNVFPDTTIQGWVSNHVSNKDEEISFIGLNPDSHGVYSDVVQLTRIKR